MRARFEDKQSLAALVQKLDSRVIAPEVISALVSLNSAYSSPSKLESFSKLKGPPPLFVITGQQVGLFGGPLLTIYKAVTAIKAAKELSKELNRAVIPVFWLQSEDHDLVEVASCTVISSSGLPKAFSYDLERAKGNRQSLSEVLLGDEISPLLQDLSGALLSEPYAVELLGTLRNCYVPDVSWSEAFFKFYSELFKDTELLFFDLNRSKLKETLSVKEVFRKSITELAQIESTLINSTKEEKIVDGVLIKPNSPLCFIEDKEKNRFRLTLEEDGFYRVKNQPNISFSKSELLELIDKAPERFSSSALLRPIIQDTLFRTLAYVGGDAELNYHHQLNTLYQQFSLLPPLLIPRSKFRLLSKKADQIVNELLLDLDDYNLENEKIGDLLRSKGKPFGIDGDLYLNEVGVEIGRLSRKFKELLEQIDPTLEEPLRKTSATALNAYSQFISRLSKASIQKDSVVLNRIERVRAEVFPFGIEQERGLGIILILARIGPGFLQLVEEQCGLSNSGFHKIVLEEL